MNFLKTILSFIFLLLLLLICIAFLFRSFFPCLFVLAARARGTRVAAAAVSDLGVGELAGEVIFRLVGRVKDALGGPSKELLNRRPINTRAVALRRVWVVWIASGIGK